MRALTIAFDGAWAAVQGLIQPLEGLWSSLTDLWNTVVGTGDATSGFMKIILEVGDVVGQAFQILGAILGGVIDGFIWLVKGATSLINESETLRNFFSKLSDVVNTGWQTFRKYFSVEGLKLS